jgi:hypothetical protein
MVRLGIVGARVGGPFALLIRRQTRLSRGVKDILVTGITVTMLLTSVATASAQNIFEALFGRLEPSPGPVPDANFAARDRQQLVNPPYRQAWIPPAYRRQIVRYHRKEAPGTILVDTDARYLITTCSPKVRRSATARSWARMLRLGPAWPQSAARKNGQDGRPPRARSGDSARFRTMSKAVQAIQWVRVRSTSTLAARTRFIASTARTSPDGSDMRFIVG